MKKRLVALVIGVLLVCTAFAAVGCGEGYANYFAVIKNPKNYRVEYKYGDDTFTEIRVKNKVALKTTWDEVGHTIPKDTEWTIYRNTYKEQNYLFYDSQFARFTSNYRWSFEKDGENWEQSETSFLGREAIVFIKKEIVAHDGLGPLEEEREYTTKYVVDKEYDILLAKYTGWDDEEFSTSFEVTLFEIGGQKIPDNPVISAD